MPEQDQAQAASEAEATEALPASRDLLRGSDLLTPQEASSIVAQGSGRLIVWAGEQSTGKTTLSAVMYERHRTRKARTRFAGSQTLLGFEERIHPARAASGRITPHTARTALDTEGRDLLHLAVKDDGTEETAHLLIADMPGEIFRQIRDHELNPTEIPLLDRADKLAVLIDGAMLASSASRSSAISYARQLIENLFGAGLAVEDMDLRLVVTKLDALLAAPGALGYWDKHEPVLLAELQAISADATSTRTAARGLPDGGEDGMDELMEWVLSEPAEPAEAAVQGAPPPAARMQRIRKPKQGPR